MEGLSYHLKADGSSPPFFQVPRPIVIPDHGRRKISTQRHHATFLINLFVTELNGWMNGTSYYSQHLEHFSSEMKSKEKKRDRTKCTAVRLKALKLLKFIFTAQYQIKN